MRKFLWLIAAFVSVCNTVLAHTDFGERPKLVVGIVVAQMRWDYLYTCYD